MALLDLFEQISVTSGKNAKKELLKQLDEQQRRLFTLALDPGAVFFQTVREIDVVAYANHFIDTHCGQPDEDVYNHFIGLAETLTTRQITGNDAAASVEAFFRECSPLQAKWFARIMNKDLRVGVESSFIDVFPTAYKVFECQLCNTYEGDRDVTGWYAEPKWNGLRALAVPNAANVYGWYSRNGKPIPGMDFLSELLAECRFPGDKQFVLDGEGFGSTLDSLEQVATSVSNIRGNKNHDRITFNVFDMIELGEWNKIGQRGFKTLPLCERKNNLSRFFHINPHLTQIKQVEFEIVGGEGCSPEEIRDRQIVLGLEGVVMKDPHGHYKPGKGNMWLKFKKRYPVDVPIVGAVEGTKKYTGKLGALVVRNPDSGVESEVGTGFSDAQRQEFWDAHLRGELAGRTAELEFGEITSDGKFFHTAFKKIRYDK